MTQGKKEGQPYKLTSKPNMPNFEFWEEFGECGEASCCEATVLTTASVCMYALGFIVTLVCTVFVVTDLMFRMAEKSKQ